MWYDLTLWEIITDLHQEYNRYILIGVIALILLFWITLSALLTLLLPKKYRQYRKEIFVFMILLNSALLFMGILLTLIMLLFGLSWATHRVSRPTYEVIDFEEYFAKLPLINSKFHEGILDISTHGHWKTITTDEKVKSLKILYESNERNNIGRIKKFLSDSSEETRLYAFSLISSYEKELNDNIKKLSKHLENTESDKEIDHFAFLLAETYWQFIFHGVADDHLATFYTQKIEEVLQRCLTTPKVSILLGKIYLFNRDFTTAKRHFQKAIEIGLPAAVVNTFLAEIEYELKNFNSIDQYLLDNEHSLTLRMKPIYQMWAQ